jgi:hypothetical protein
MAPPPPGWASPWGPGGCLRLLALTVLGLISVNAEPGARRVTKGQIPFRYARPPTQNRDRGGEHKNASGALRWATHMADASEGVRLISAGWVRWVAAPCARRAHVRLGTRLVMSATGAGSHEARGGESGETR